MSGITARTSTRDIAAYDDNLQPFRSPLSKKSPKRLDRLEADGSLKSGRLFGQPMKHECSLVTELGAEGARDVVHHSRYAQSGLLLRMWLSNSC